MTVIQWTAWLISRCIVRVVSTAVSVLQLTHKIYVRLNVMMCCFLALSLNCVGAVSTSQWTSSETRFRHISVQPPSVMDSWEIGWTWRIDSSHGHWTLKSVNCELWRQLLTLSVMKIVLLQVLSYHATAPLQQLDKFKVRTSLSQLLITFVYHSICYWCLDKQRPQTIQNRRDPIWQS